MKRIFGLWDWERREMRVKQSILRRGEETPRNRDINPGILSCLSCMSCHCPQLWPSLLYSPIPLWWFYLFCWFVDWGWWKLSKGVEFNIWVSMRRNWDHTGEMIYDDPWNEHFRASGSSELEVTTRASTSLVLAIQKCWEAMEISQLVEQGIESTLCIY